MSLIVESNKMDPFENLSSKVPFWKVDLPKSPWDFDEDSENLLCDLVRNQYLKRLRQTLFDNLDVGPKGFQKSNLFKIQQCVDICMVEMEKQALRRCMVAHIYREAMTNMINEVKACTNNSVLYVFLENLIESNNQLSLWNKCIGTKNITKQPVNVGINTEQKSNQIASTQTEICMDYDINLSNSTSVHNDNIDFLKISNTVPSSYNVKTEVSESNVFNNLNTLLNPSSNSSSFSINKLMEVNNDYDSKVPSHLLFKSEPEKCKFKNETKDIMSINSLLRDLQDSPEYEQQSSLSEEHLAELTINDHKGTENCYEFLTSVYINPNLVRPQKISEILMDKFKSERVAKSYELKKSMNELTKEVQIRLMQKFDDLFGAGHSYESDPLSEEEERIIAHKRIVKMVVEFMTPYYKAHRISRHLFKCLAKLISKNLMDRAYDPDEKTVARGVSEFFTGNRCIKTTEDIYH